MFDRYVQGTKPSWKRRAVLTVSLALHGIAAIRVFLNVFREKDLFEIRKRQAGLAANRTDQA